MGSKEERDHRLDDDQRSEKWSLVIVFDDSMCLFHAVRVLAIQSEMDYIRFKSGFTLREERGFI